MKPLLTLYLKELRDNRIPTAVLLVVGACMQTYAYVKLPHFPGVNGFWLAIPAGLPLIISGLAVAFLLLHALNAEWRGNTHHLLLSLPVPKWWIVLIKCAATITLSGILFAASCAGAYALYLSIVTRPENNGNLIGFVDFWMIAFGWFFALALPLSGLITATWGLSHSVKRRRGYVAAASMVVAAYCLAKITGPGIRAFQFLGQFRYESVKPDGRVFVHAMELAWWAFPALLGVFLLAFGLYLFHRFVEI